ncbi:hypothetical protein ABBQ38_011854 [Trebouxia sp. C0009 RCD-2024]
MRSLRHLLSLTTGCALSAILGMHGLTPPAHAITTEQLLFLEAWRAIDRAYVDKSFNNQSWFRLREQYLKNEPMHDRSETYAAINKSIKSLNDPFTRLLEPTRYQALKRGNQGAVIGVGLEVGFGEGTNSQLVVVTPAPGGPADRAGLQAGDIIAAIDGKPTNGASLYDAGDMLQGAEGSEVTLDVSSKSKVRTVKLTRQRITLKPVTWQMCGSASSAVGPADASGKLAYVRVATFNKQTTESAKAALRQLKADGATRYVLDIRNNGGGLFPAGVELARMLLDSGDIVLIADSQGVMDSYEATGTAIDARAPVAVLVNKGTASASEVFAGAVQDNKRATIAGETTFGKGLIQTIVELSDGSAVSVTVARYQTPAGTDINKVGIKPDVLLDDQTLLPADSQKFCQVIASPSAPKLFR